MKKLNKKQVSIIFFSLCLMVWGAYIALSPFISKSLIVDKGKTEMKTSPKDMKKNTEKTSSSTPKKDNRKLETDNSKKEVTPLTLEELMKNRLEDKKLDSIGIISLPDVGIKLPVLKGVTYDTMMYGAGTAKDNQVMGERNFALASHSIYNSYNTNSLVKNLLFGNLVDSKIGQSIYLTNKQKVYKYMIDNIYRVNENQSEILSDHKDKKEITLYTCTSLKSKDRLVVHGSLTEVTSYKANSGLF